MKSTLITLFLTTTTLCLYGQYNPDKPNLCQRAFYTDFPTEKHDYNLSKRTAAYPFLAKHLGLDVNKVMKDGKIDESPNAILSVEDLQVFNKEHPKPATALSGNEAISAALNKK